MAASSWQADAGGGRASGLIMSSVVMREAAVLRLADLVEKLAGGIAATKPASTLLFGRLRSLTER